MFRWTPPHIINSSPVSCVVPLEFKTTIVKPLLKKPSLYHTNLEKKKNNNKNKKNKQTKNNNNNKTIARSKICSFLSKVLEKKNLSVSTLCLPLFQQPSTFNKLLLQVSLLCRAQHWDGTTESDKWHTACFGRWQHFCLTSLGLVGCLRHHRSQNSTRQTWKSLWYLRLCSIVVQILSHLKDSNGDHLQQHLKTIHSLLLRAAGLCPRPCLIHFVHKTTFKLDRTSLSPPQWGAADAEIKGPSGENAELKRSPFKAWSRSIYSHTCYAYCQAFLPCLFLHFRSIHLHFFQTSPDFSCVGCG